MAFAQARVNTSVLQRFGTPVQLDGVTVQGDFTAGMKEHVVGEMAVNAAEPMCLVASADVPANPVGKPLVPPSGVTYTVREIRADGLGLTVLVLQRGL